MSERVQNGQQGPRRCLLPHFKNRMMKPPNTVLAHACPIHLSHNVFAQRRQRAAVEHAAGSVPISSRLNPLCSRSTQLCKCSYLVGPAGTTHGLAQLTTAAAEEECYNQCTNQLLLPCSAMLSQPSSATAAASQQPARQLAQHEKHCACGTCNHLAHAEPPSAVAHQPPTHPSTPAHTPPSPHQPATPSLKQSAPPPAAAAAPGAC